MAHPGFGHLWQQADMSDMDIVISCSQDAAPADDDAPGDQNSAPALLQQFPGHSTILSLSPFFKAQALRWSKAPQPRKAKGKAGSKRQAKQQVTITLPDASYEPAAMAVLAGLYQVEPWPKLLFALTPQQQVQAAVLADLWQLTAASQAAVGVLQEETDIADRLAAVLEQLLSMEAVPDCLMPVFERVLLSKYGDLEGVWGTDHAALQDSLLALPLHAMELLLASDKLEVASEDTVLFTAQAYVDKQATSSNQQQAVIALAPLVRCPHLSQHWLSAAVLSDDADKLLLQGLQPQLKRLLLLKPTCSTPSGLSVADIKRGVPNVPASWLLPVRDIQPISSVALSWEVDVAAIRQAAEGSATRQSPASLTSTASCPLGGVRWGMELQCVWDPSKQGSTVGLFAEGRSLPDGSFCDCTYILSCAGVAALTRIGSGYIDNRGEGWADFFRVGAMSGGFDEAAWASRGLPTSGSIVLMLNVSSVGI